MKLTEGSLATAGPNTPARSGGVPVSGGPPQLLQADESQQVQCDAVRGQAPAASAPGDVTGDDLCRVQRGLGPGGQRHLLHQ